MRLSQVSPRECAVSAVTVYELFCGVEKSQTSFAERQKVEQFLDTNGQTVTATLAFSDTLGHRATNAWPFKLELTFLVSTDTNSPYKRLVLSVADNPGAHTVSLVTTQAALADILLQGTVRFLGAEFVPDPEGFQPASETGGITIDLGGKTLYDANNVTLQTVSGRLFFDPDISISAELRGPRTFDLDVSASLAFDLTPHATETVCPAHQKPRRGRVGDELLPARAPGAGGQEGVRGGRGEFVLEGVIPTGTVAAEQRTLRPGSWRIPTGFHHSAQPRVARNGLARSSQPLG